MEASLVGEKERIELPLDQQEFIRELCRVNPNTVLVLVAGSPLAITWEQANIPAIVDAWYLGEKGGTAVAEILFGEYNPPVKELRGFTRVHLMKGESKTVTVPLRREDLRYWSEEKGCFVVPEGLPMVYVGSSSTDIRIEK